MAVSAYAGYYNYQFGPNYIRNIGIMNIASSDPNFVGNKAIAGPGNLQPTIGTGNIIYAQAGLLLPSQAENQKSGSSRSQPILIKVSRHLINLPRNLMSVPTGLSTVITQKSPRNILQGRCTQVQLTALLPKENSLYNFRFTCKTLNFNH